jgi:crotonobetainyl-CoA:carnitine CoA-transferase CaiB-like acyl-CoA transferase
MAGPLAGLVVLDLSRILAGPWATQLLADFGAEVIKVEHPRGGDDTRSWGPPYLHDAEGRATSESAYYLSTNRGKRSVAIDLARPEGQELVRGLAAQADVLVENFKVGGLARYGLGYRDVQPSNPALIYLSISAFGQDGPDAAEPGYDAMIQGMGGLMSITGLPDGEAGAGPQKVGVAVADLMCGMYAATGILAALHERQASGQGQYIDLSLLDTQVAWLANQNLNYLVGGMPPVRRGTAHPNIVPYQAFATKDSWLMLAVGNDRQFEAFCSAAGRKALAKDKRFRANADRVAHREALILAIEKVCRQKTTTAWVKVLAAAGVPCGPINNLAEVFREPQVKHRKLRFDLPHAKGARLPQVRHPALFSRMTSVSSEPPPLLGEHTRSVLSDELGLTSDELLSLLADGAIG